MISKYNVGDIVKIVGNTKPSYECYQLHNELGVISSVYGDGCRYGVCMCNGVMNPDSKYGLFYFEPEDITSENINKRQIDGNIKYLSSEIDRLKFYNQIEKVIFNGPATIILWTNGEKTVVKCQNGDKYDKEKGFAMAFMKYACGNKGNYNNLIKNI